MLKEHIFCFIHICWFISIDSACLVLINFSLLFKQNNIIISVHFDDVKLLRIFQDGNFNHEIFHDRYCWVLHYLLMNNHKIYDPISRCLNYNFCYIGNCNTSSVKILPTSYYGSWETTRWQTKALPVYTIKKLVSHAQKIIINQLHLNWPYNIKKHLFIWVWYSWIF